MGTSRSKRDAEEAKAKAKEAKARLFSCVNCL